LDERAGGSIWRAGRAWLWGRSNGPLLHVEWSHLKRPRLACVLSVNRGDERGWLFSLSLLFGTWYIGRGEYSFTSRRFGFEIIDGDWVRIFIGRRDADWSVKASGWEISVRVLDVLLGRSVFREGPSELHDNVLIPMPERSYPARIRLHEDSWKRPRWPWARYLRRASIDFIEEGGNVPVPGKGENAWDCGIDGIYGMTCPARDVAAAVGAVVESAYRTRIRHGGTDWRPAPVVRGGQEGDPR
jgi:hypothetical protein